MSCTNSVASRAIALPGIGTPAMLVRMALMQPRMGAPDAAGETRGQPADRIARSLEVRARPALRAARPG